MDTLINEQLYFACSKHSYQDSFLISEQGRKCYTLITFIQAFIFHVACMISITLNNFLHPGHGFLMPKKIYISQVFPVHTLLPCLLVYQRLDITPKNLEAVVEVEVLGSDGDNDGNYAIEG